MIKSVLNSIPKKVIEILVRLQRRFLWGGVGDEIKITWVK